MIRLWLKIGKKEIENNRAGSENQFIDMQQVI